MLLCLGVYGTIFDVDLIANAGNSVYFARCFEIPFIFCGIQVFLNFPCGFIYSSCVFSESYQCGQFFMDTWKKNTLYISLPINRLFVTRTKGSRYLQ